MYQSLQEHRTTTTSQKSPPLSCAASLSVADVVAVGFVVPVTGIVNILNSKLQGSTMKTYRWFPTWRGLLQRGSKWLLYHKHSNCGGVPGKRMPRMLHIQSVDSAAPLNHVHRVQQIWLLMRSECDEPRFRLIEMLNIPFWSLINVNAPPSSRNVNAGGSPSSYPWSAAKGLMSRQMNGWK